MRLGFYYHIPLLCTGDKLFVPGYLGIFLDALAKEVDTLYLFMHEANAQQAHDADYELTNKNIQFVNIGPTVPAWYRHLFDKKILKQILPASKNCDAILIRSPTPLAPFFKPFSGGAKLIFMIVGNYLEGAKQFKIKNPRDWLMVQYLKRNDYLFRKEMRTTDVLVNAPSLLKTYAGVCRSIHLIGTTTLSDSDFFSREDTCASPIVKLLYTGRFEAAKGLFELVEAVHQLNKTKVTVKLHLVGWEAENKNIVQKALLAKAVALNIENDIIFEGRKKIGTSLNEMYRLADIYVIPSYHEGFPRTIWEAMANSLPVIATNVGGIPDYLSHKENALLIKPKSSSDIASHIRMLIDDKTLRIKLIKNGYQLAKNNTVNVQTKKIAVLIKQLISA